MKSDLKLSIIVTSYKSPQLIELCLDSIQKKVRGISYEVIVSDSATEEVTYDLMKKDRFSEVTFFPHDENMGFGRLASEGLKVAKGEFYFVINTDIIVRDKSVSKLVEYLEANPKVGMVGPKLINFDNTVQQSCFRFYSPLTVLYRRTFLKRFSFAKKQLERFEMKKEQSRSKIFEADWLMGSAMMVRAEAVKEVGFFDSRYFMYFEDVDWCWEFWKKGYKVIYNPNVSVYHYHGKASASKGVFNAIFTNRYARAHIESAVKFFLKHLREKNPVKN